MVAVAQDGTAIVALAAQPVLMRLGCGGGSAGVQRGGRVTAAARRCRRSRSGGPAPRSGARSSRGLDINALVLERRLVLVGEVGVGAVGWHMVG